jgi:deazaflavin-dependent oxidoreductase (nitroreductase family)
VKRLLLERVYNRGVNPAVLRHAGRRWSPWAIVRHVDRRSGRAYATPVLWPRETHGGVRILVAFGPDTDWCRNILAAGRFTVRWHGREYALADPELSETHGAWRLLRRSRYLTARKVEPAARRS